MTASQPQNRPAPILLQPVTTVDEQRLLALAALHPPLADVVLDPEQLRATDFYADPHPLIYTVMRALKKNEQPINYVSVAMELRKRGKPDAAGYVLDALHETLIREYETPEVVSWIKALQARRAAAEKQEAQEQARKALDAGDPEQAKAALEKIATPAPKSYVNAPPTPMRASDLAMKVIEPTRYYIPNMLRSGLALYIGNPGIGKTPALMQLGIAFASGGRWLGALPCRKSKVLYIGVEYDEAYIKEVLIDSIGSPDLPPDLYIHSVETFTSPSTADESIATLEYYLKVMGVEVIIIDVFSGFLPRENFKQNAYRGDYAEFLAYHRLCMEYKALLVGAWHGGKHNKDPETAYNGGQGMWGSAGGGRLTMFYDESQQVRLRSQLRGHDRMEWLLEQARIGDAHFWSVIDADPDPILGSEAQTRIYQAVKNHGTFAEPISPAGVRAVLRADAPDNCPADPYIRQTLSRLSERGLITKVGGGYIVQKRGSGGSPGSFVTCGSPGSGGSLGSDTSQHEISDPHGSLSGDEWIAPEAHQDAKNEGAIQAIQQNHRSTGSGTDPRRSNLPARLMVAGWAKEHTTEGYRYTHPTLGSTAWHKVPYHAMAEAENISKPAEWESAEGY